MRRQRSRSTPTTLLMAAALAVQGLTAALQAGDASEFGNPLAKTLPYLPDLLHASGYRTAAFVGSILLDPAKIVENIHDAYGHPHFRDKAYSLLMSGPSGSADIAGDHGPSCPGGDNTYRCILAASIEGNNAEFRKVGAEPDLPISGVP